MIGVGHGLTLRGSGPESLSRRHHGQNQGQRTYMERLGKLGNLLR